MPGSVDSPPSNQGVTMCRTSRLERGTLQMGIPRLGGADPSRTGPARFGLSLQASTAMSVRSQVFVLPKTSWVQSIESRRQNRVQLTSRGRGSLPQYSGFATRWTDAH